MEWLNELAMTGASTLVGAITTQAWQSARSRFLAIFGEDTPGKGLARRLDDDESKLAGLDPQAQQQAREGLASEWQVRLKDLLSDHPEAGEALRAWTEQVRAQLPAVHQEWVQHNLARDQATQYNVQGGNQHIHHPGPGTHA